MKKISIIFIFTISCIVSQAQQEFELRLSTKALDLIEIGTAQFSGDNKDIIPRARKILNNDLKLSGIFQVVPEKNMNLVPAPESLTTVNFKKFLSVGAKILIVGQLETLNTGSLLFSAIVYDAQAGNIILSRKYRGEPDMLLNLVHSFSDEIIYVFSGRKGVTNSRIAYVSDITGYREVFIMDYDGNNNRQMTKLNSITIFPAVSPDRKMIAFTSYKKDNPDLYLLTVGSKTIKTVYSAEGIGSTPDFSFDNKYMVFSASLKGNTDIYIYEIATEKTTRLTTGQAIDTSPRFSPKAKEIVFTSDRYGSPRIYSMDRDGLNVKKLNTIGTYNDSPVWSPDGDQIAYVSMFNNRFDVFIYSFSRNQNIRLTTNEKGSNEYPAWSPDGRRIAFCSRRSGNWHIYSVNLNGDNIVQLTYDGNNTCPFWIE